MFSVHFTTRRERTVFDTSGAAILHERTDVEVVLHNVPGSTAMSYAKCDNFRMEREFADPDPVKRSPHRKSQPADEVVKAVTSVTPKVSALKNAAATGNMSAAINGAK